MTIRSGIRTKALELRAPLALLCLLATAGLASACKPGVGKTAYVGATVFDGTTRPPIVDAVIIVAGGKIEQLGPPDLVSVPRGAEEIRVDGRWVIPGLIDAHTHAERWALPRFLAYGVTSIRDMGGIQDSVAALRDETSVLSTVGPRMYISGAIIDGGPNVVQATVVRTGSQARRAIDQVVLIDVAQAKIFTKIDQRLLQPLMDEASVLNVPVAAHLGKVDAVTAARMGVSVIEHMSGVVEASVSNPRQLFRAHDNLVAGWNLAERRWAALDSAALQRTARTLADAGVAIVPTLAKHESYSRLSSREYRDGLDLSGVPDSIQEAWDLPGFIRRGGLTGGHFRAFRQGRRAQNQFVRLFTNAGGLIAAGSDAAGPLLAPGASLHQELALLVEAGREPRDALFAATRDAARLLAADSIGVLQPGSVADFVVLTDNPLEDIANTRAIFMIVHRGTRYRPEDFAEEWKPAGADTTQGADTAQ